MATGFYDFGALYAREIVATIALVLPPGRTSNVRYQHIRHVEERLSNNHPLHIGLSGLPLKSGSCAPTQCHRILGLGCSRKDFRKLCWFSNGIQHDTHRPGIEREDHKRQCCACCVEKNHDMTRYDTGEGPRKKEKKKAESVPHTTAFRRAINLQRSRQSTQLFGKSILLTQID